MIFYHWMPVVRTLWLHASLAVLWPTWVECDQPDSFSWPDQDIGKKTTETVAAGKKAAKWIACEVCAERLLALFPPDGDDDQIERTLVMGLPQWVSDTKKLCDMKPLAQLFGGRGYEVKVHTDGSAELYRSNGTEVFYNETNDAELNFHWKSFAVRHACLETFRKRGDEISKKLSEVYRNVAKKGKHRLALMTTVYGSATVACQEAKICKGARKLIEAKANRTRLEQTIPVNPHTDL